MCYNNWHQRTSINLKIFTVASKSLWTFDRMHSMLKLTCIPDFYPVVTSFINTGLIFVSNEMAQANIMFKSDIMPFNAQLSLVINTVMPIATARLFLWQHTLHIWKAEEEFGQIQQIQFEGDGLQNNRTNTSCSRACLVNNVLPRVTWLFITHHVTYFDQSNVRDFAIWNQYNITSYNIITFSIIWM